MRRLGVGEKWILAAAEGRELGPWRRAEREEHTGDAHTNILPKASGFEGKRGRNL